MSFLLHYTNSYVNIIQDVDVILAGFIYFSSLTKRGHQDSLVFCS